MPVMNGLEAARQIAKTFPNVPLLLFTFTVSNEVKAQAVLAGFQQALAKEEGIRPLIAAIESALNNRNKSVRASGEALPPADPLDAVARNSERLAPAQPEPLLQNALPAEGSTVEASSKSKA